jgi:uncharacterized protein with HEPN domain
VRNFEIIGEAARHIDAVTATRLGDIPWQDMRDLRNLLIHEYFGISVAIIWETMSRDLRPVREAIRRDLARSDRRGIRAMKSGLMRSPPAATRRRRHSGSARRAS